MPSRFHRAAVPAGLALAAALVVVVGTAGLRGGAPSSTADSEVTGSIADPMEAIRLPLSEEQRGHIFDGIMRVRDAPVADVAVPQPVRTLPSSVALQDLPASVTDDVPIVQGYKFVKLDDRVLLVSPLDRTVVAEMPRYRLIVD